MDGVVHFEIPAKSVKRAQKFYSDIFGWEMTPFPQMNYVSIRTTAVDKKMRPKRPGMINGGMMKKTAKIKSPVVYMYVKDVNSTLNRIKKNGGSVVQGKTHIMNKMYMAYFKDSEGNVMALVQGM